MLRSQASIARGHGMNFANTSVTKTTIPKSPEQLMSMWLDRMKPKRIKNELEYMEILMNGLMAKKALISEMKKRALINNGATKCKQAT